MNLYTHKFRVNSKGLKTSKVGHYDKLNLVSTRENK